MRPLRTVKEPGPNVRTRGTCRRGVSDAVIVRGDDSISRKPSRRAPAGHPPASPTPAPAVLTAAIAQWAAAGHPVRRSSQGPPADDSPDCEPGQAEQEYRSAAACDRYQVDPSCGDYIWPGKMPGTLHARRSARLGHLRCPSAQATAVTTTVTTSMTAYPCGNVTVAPDP